MQFAPVNRLAAGLLAIAVAPWAHAATLPPGFSQEVIATGFTGATALAIAPDGRLFICEQTGELRVIKDDVLLARPFVKLRVDSFWERGLIGVAFDPRFSENHHLYVCYVTPDPYPHHRISRLTASGDAAAGSEVVLFEGDDQGGLGGSVPAGHQGGAIHFGKDGKLYAAIGEQTAGQPAQAIDSLLGKILRLNPDGSIPEDNPFVSATSGKYRAIWARGCRNPFTFAVQPGSGRMLINDVGGAREEINEGAPGANFGWPVVEHGERGGAGFTGPLHSYPVSSITGGDFLGPPPFRVLVIRRDDDLHRAAHEAAFRTLVELGNAVGFKVAAAGPADFTSEITAERLRRHRVIVFLSAPPPALGADARRAIEEHVASGGGLVAIHDGALAPEDWKWYAEMIGAGASGGARVHACSPPRERACRTADPLHPATKTLPAAWSWSDGWIALDRPPSPGAHVLVTASDDSTEASAGGGETAVSWCREARGGRAFSTLLGHGREAWSGRLFREHVLGGILYAADTVRSPVARTFPERYHGKYFFLDFAKGWLKVLDPDNPAKAEDFAAGLPRPVDLRFAPDGSLYILNRDMWVKDQSFQPGTGSVIRLRHHGTGGATPVPLASLPEPPPAPPRPPPPIAPPSGLYTGEVTVRLELGATADVRYTTDGSLPSARSSRYRGPFRLSAPAVVVAQEFRGDRPAGTAKSAVYEIRPIRPYGMPERPPASINVSLDPSALPRLLSETRLFVSVADLAPSAGVIPYDVISPLWSDGAGKRRWIVLPGGEAVRFRPKGEWSFPRGTVFVKHFELEGLTRRPLETRLLVVTGADRGYGVTYRWRADGSDADILADSMEEEVEAAAGGAPARRTWYYPSRDDCLRCHTRAAGFVLGVKARQLNREFTYPATGLSDNQLRTWSYLGMLDDAPLEEEIAALDRLTPLAAAGGSLESRVRSYLDSNCANCHRPGADIPSAFDARFDTPLAEAGILDAPTVSDSLGIPRPRVVAPGDPERSLLYRRMVLPERFKMPPLARNRVDEEAAAAVREWIGGLGGR